MRVQLHILLLLLVFLCVLLLFFFFVVIHALWRFSVILAFSLFVGTDLCRSDLPSFVDVAAFSSLRLNQFFTLLDVLRSHPQPDLG